MHTAAHKASQHLTLLSYNIHKASAVAIGAIDWNVSSMSFRMLRRTSSACRKSIAMCAVRGLMTSRIY